MTEESFSSEKVQRKFAHETSADNLLRQSPTMLDFYAKPANTEANRLALQELGKQMIPPKDGAFSKLQKRRIEKKIAQLQSMQPD